MAVKTREKLIDVARQLFARNGIENTTMNDIAEASDKGRRTIYTYFKNKLEIFNAVVERESEQSVAKLRQVLTEDISATAKLKQYLKLKFNAVQEALVRQESLYSYFSLDLKRFNRIRRLTLIKETEILQTILNEGKQSGEFNPNQTAKLSSFVNIIFQGADIAIHKDYSSETTEKTNIEDTIIEFIIEGIKQK